MTDALQFVFNQLLKDIFISIPGIIEEYNQSTKRCRVKPAINIRLTDGTTVEQSTIANVPVLWPGGGGFTLLSPLPAGSAVEIRFSQRGITQFKDTFGTADPSGGVFSKEDAHVIPCFGALSISPATNDGISMQSEDGANYIFVEDGNIEINSTGTIEINAESSVLIKSPDNTVQGPLKVTGLLTAQAGINTTDISMSGGITGPVVFGGADGDAHAHTQGADSDGDTQQKTNGPS